VQLYRYSVSQSSEFCRHNPLCCFSTSVYCCLFRYRLSPETFGYTLLYAVVRNSRNRFKKQQPIRQPAALQCHFPHSKCNNEFQCHDSLPETRLCYVSLTLLDGRVIMNCGSCKVLVVCTKCLPGGAKGKVVPML
jgi:hypothetical protein